jgi:competence protein ComEC
MADGRLIALSLKPDGLADDCTRATLVVTAMPAPKGCEATVIELKRLRAQGTMALRRQQRGFIVDAVRPRGTNRPWSPSSGDYVEAEANSGGGGANPARPADATPAEQDLQTED